MRPMAPGRFPDDRQTSPTDRRRRVQRPLETHLKKLCRKFSETYLHGSGGGISPPALKNYGILAFLTPCRTQL